MKQIAWGRENGEARGRTRNAGYNNVLASMLVITARRDGSLFWVRCRVSQRKTTTGSHPASFEGASHPIEPLACLVTAISAVPSSAATLSSTGAIPSLTGARLLPDTPVFHVCAYRWRDTTYGGYCSNYYCPGLSRCIKQHVQKGACSEMSRLISCFSRSN